MRTTTKQEEAPRVGTYGTADPGVMTKVNNLTEMMLTNTECLHGHHRIEHGADPGDDSTLAKVNLPEMDRSTEAPTEEPGSKGSAPAVQL